MSSKKQKKLKVEKPDLAEDEGTYIEWQVHPVKRRPWVSLSVTIFVMVIGVMVYLATASRGFTVLALVILFASLAKFYFPTFYRLSDKRITVKTTTQTLHKSWKQFRSCYPDKNGILLSPFAEPSRLENFRGLYIMAHDNREEIIAFIKERLAGKHLKEDTPAPVESPEVQDTGSDRGTE